MDFRFDAEQLALQAAVRSFCVDHLPLTSIGEREGRAAAGELWSGLADLGVLGLLAEGATDVGPVEAALVMEVLGAALVPGPVLWSIIAAQLVPGVAAGEVRVTGVLVTDPTLPVVVPHPYESDVLLVVRSDGVEQVRSAELHDGAAGAALDPLTPMVGFPALPSGEVVGGEEAAQQLRLLGTTLAAAALVGLAQGALDEARRYALSREQFGRPIGSFQAVKHLLADMFVRVELARSATYAAAALIAAPMAGSPTKGAAVAKLLAGEAAISNGRTGIQVLGGMGFTWDMLAHYYLKRAWVLEIWFGSQAEHARSLAAEVDADVDASDAA
jgi:alkylation response protein AidB-like acyl-CoA dehydrogenase